MIQKIRWSCVYLLCFFLIFLTDLPFLFSQVNFDKMTIDSNFNAYFVTACDLDKDGHMDILSGHTDLAWWENNGSGSFTKHFISSDVSALWSIYAVDLDGDGDKDLLIADSGNHDIVWYRNNNWNFERIVIESNFTNAESVAGADFDGDGDIDITGLTVGTETQSGMVVWWENNGSEQFSRRDIDLNFDRGHKIVVEDIDYDGDVDIIACAKSSSGVSWFKNNCGGNFHKKVLYPKGVLGISIADMDNNGTLDILACEPGTGRVDLLIHNGNGFFSNKVIGSGLSGPRFAAPGDVDADGLLDAIVVNRDSDDMIWLENLGGNSFSIHSVGDGINGPFVCDAADFDNDGGADPVTGSKETNDLWCWRTSGQSPTESITVQYPKGGEHFNSDETINISWNWNGDFDQVKIEFSPNNGSSWQVITYSTGNDGSYSWPIPDINSTKCLVKISEKDSGSPSDLSNSVFTINKTDPITVESPNGGETWLTNSSYTIEWATDNSFDFVRIDFSMDGGVIWSTIANYEDNDGSYDWNTPDISSENYLIKIMNADDNNINDESNSQFSIIDASDNMIIAINCADIYKLYVNGEYIGIDSTWDVAQKYTVTDWNHKNVFAVYGKNRGSGDGALIIEVSLNDNVIFQTSSSEWRCTNSLIEGWTETDYNDDDWGIAESLGQFGELSWDKDVSGFPDNSTAHWIWGDQSDQEIYFRGSFFVDPTVPVELSYFRIFKKDNHSVLLKWKTESEKNNLGFEIQKSLANDDFSKIGFVPGAGTSNSKNEYKFLDNIQTKGYYRYRLKQIDYDGSFSYSEEKTIHVFLPNKVIIYPNYPNPFNHETLIKYSLPDAGHVRISVYDVSGRLIKVLKDDHQQRGFYDIIWHGMNHLNHNVPSGIYFIRLSFKNKPIKTIKLGLIK